MLIYFESSFSTKEFFKDLQRRAGATFMVDIVFSPMLLAGSEAIRLISISNKGKAGKNSPDQHKKTRYWRLSKNLFLWPKLANYSQ